MLLLPLTFQVAGKVLRSITLFNIEVLGAIDQINCWTLQLYRRSIVTVYCKAEGFFRWLLLVVQTI